MDEVMVFKQFLDAGNITQIYNNQSKRFVTSGTQNNTFNITAGYNSIVISGVYENFSSSVNLSLYFQNDTGWFLSEEQQFDGENEYSICPSAFNITTNFKLISTPTYQFYTPLLIGENSFTRESLYPCNYIANSGDWNCNRQCTISNQFYNITNGTDYKAVKMQNGCNLTLINMTILSNKRSVDTSGNVYFNLSSNSTWRFI
jgi:hypothetical protein